MSDDLDSALKAFLEDPESLTDDELIALQKQTNPYAHVIPDDRERILALSFTNLREKYLKRLAMTSLVGFTFRMQEEWDPPAALRSWVPKRRARPSDDSPMPEATPHRPDELVAGAEELLARARLFEAASKRARDILIAAEEARSEAAAAELVEAAQKGGKFASDQEATETKEADQEPAEADQGPAEADQEAKKEPHKKVLSAKQLAQKAKDLTEAAISASGVAHRARLDAVTAFEAAGRSAGDRVLAAATAAEGNPHSEAQGRTVRMERPPAHAIEMPPRVAKALVLDFLKQHFEFNPDAHVRSAFDEFVLAKRVPTAEAAAEIAEIAAAHAVANNYTQQPAPTVDPEDPYRPSIDDLLATLPKGDPRRIPLERVPPQDTFHRWNFYETVNYDALREATAALYHEKPDLDMAIAPFEVFATDSAGSADSKFDNYKIAHQRELIGDLCAIRMNAWNLTGAFAQNRQKVDILGPEMGILKRIFERHSEDEQMGKELMQHRIKKAKARNIATAGPDDPALAQYIKHGAADTSASAAGTRALSPEELARLEKTKGDLAEARRIEEDELYEAEGYAVALLGAAKRVGAEKPPTTEDLLVVGGGRLRVAGDEGSSAAIQEIMADTAECVRLQKIIRERARDLPLVKAAETVVRLSAKRAAERRLSDDEKRELATAHRDLRQAREQAEVPENTVKTDVFVAGPSGMTRTTRYIEAEAPIEFGKAMEELTSGRGAPKRPKE